MEDNTAAIEAPPVQVSSTGLAETIDAASADQIQMDEFDRLQKRAVGEDTSGQVIDPNTPPQPDDRPRGPDGKFLPKEGEPEEVEDDAKVETPAKVVEQKPAPAAKVAAPAPITAPTAPVFDFDAIMEAVDAEVKAMTFKDTANGQTVDITGEQSLTDYGQIAEPLMKRQDLAIRKVVERFTEIVKPLMEIAQAREAETHQTDVQQTIAAVVAAGVPDAADLFVDPRMIEWANANPQYKSLLVADPDRAEDLKYVFEKFRASIGAAKPAATAAKAKSVSPVQRPRSVQAGISTARGEGARNEGGSISGTPEQIQEAEFNRLEKLHSSAAYLQSGRL